MGVLEIIAKQRLGPKALLSHPRLRHAFEKAEKAAHKPTATEDEKARIAAMVELCFEYDRETDPEEKVNILDTLDEITANAHIQLPATSIEAWEADLKTKNNSYAEVERRAKKDIKAFLDKYFLLRARAGLETQSALAKASGLSRSYIAVIETGEHFPQQKTLQKLARAFKVEITALLP